MKLLGRTLYTALYAGRREKLPDAAECIANEGGSHAAIEFLGSSLVARLPWLAHLQLAQISNRDTNY
jgi:hypothetical protein